MLLKGTDIDFGSLTQLSNLVFSQNLPFNFSPNSDRAEDLFDGVSSLFAKPHSKPNRQCQMKS